jgi:hypothetical protein
MVYLRTGQTVFYIEIPEYRLLGREEYGLEKQQTEESKAK